ncbi:unnamed protein product [Cuscuta campestris]|uniref:Uncharacterized protein n=1 Tax=Cuscuta campestris TaxID=132261 RepID=A0A484KRV5_9ASTE|nr:unnamed protein product [Cuscuta campestris]
MACRFAFLLSVKNRRWTPSLPFAFFTTVRLQLRCSPDSFFFLSRSVPSLAAMIVSDSDSATPSPNSRQAGQSASDRNPGHTPSPRPSPSAVPGHKRRRLRKQYPSSTPVDEGSRVELDENIMALCHCQITDRGFADATDMVGPSIEVQGALPSVASHAPHLMPPFCLSLAGLGFEFVQDELRHQPDLLRDIPGGHQPDQLKDIPEEGLDCGPFVKLQDLGEEMDSDLLLSRFTAERKRKRETKGQGKHSSSHHEEGPSREPVVIAVEGQKDATQEPGTMAGQSPPHPVMQGGDLAGSSQGIALERPPSPPVVTYEVATGGRSTRLCIPLLPQSLGDVQLETLITLPAEDQARISAGSEDDLDNMVLLRLSQAMLGMIEVVGWKRGRQAAADEVMKAAEAKQKELQEEVARLTRELEEKENRCAALIVEKASQENRCVALEADKASLSLVVESVSARVVELEGEKSDLIQQLEVERSDRVRHAEGAVESFKSSPDFTVVAMERMEELTAAWLTTEPGAQWMVKEGTKSFNCGLFHAQQVFHNRLAQLPKGFSLPDLGFPPPCRSLAEFDPSPYLDGGSSSASEEEEEEEVEGGQSDQNPGASLAMSKAVWAQLLVPARLPARAQSLDWPSCRPIDPMPFTVSDWTFARLKPALSIFPTGRLLLRRSLPLPPPPPPNPYEDFNEAYEALSANRLPDGRIDWDAPCPLHSLQCMAWDSFQDEHLPLLEHECAYYASFERWTSESRTSSPVRPSEEVVLGKELGSPLPRLACRSLPQKTPRRPEVARAASGSPSSPR